MAFLIGTPFFVVMENKDRQICSALAAKAYREAFDLLVAAYGERMYWQIRRLVFSHDDADDILQDCYLKVWRALPKFRSESGIYTWLYRIVTNESLNFLRREKFLSKFSSVDAETAALRKIDEDPYFNGDKLQRELYKCIARLPAKQRLVFEMRYFDEVEYREMSRMLGTSEGALKASYHIAYTKIKDELKGLLEE